MESLGQLDVSLRDVWTTQLVYEALKATGAQTVKRTAERNLESLGALPQTLTAEKIHDEWLRLPTACVVQWQAEAARRARKHVIFIQVKAWLDGTPCLHANDARGTRYWLPLARLNQDDRQHLDELGAVASLKKSLEHLQQFLKKNLAVFPHAETVAWCREIESTQSIELCLLGYPPVMQIINQSGKKKPSGNAHLKHLEDESIHILREAVAEAENPVMMYSVGKDSSVMLHLARKAFYPAPPPFPLLHVDTRWKFQEMYMFRDYMSQQSGMKLLVHINPDAIARNINPFDHGSSLHTDITKTEGLKQALDLHKFDVIFGGARRDEEKSRAKERIFSFRTKNHIWDPKNQRPELWSLYNTRKSQGESIRVFPISNWTELDIWQYIYQEAIPVVPLYFAKTRPVIERDGMLMMIDDARTQLLPGEQIQARQVRFRTLGCYPLTGAVESNAQNLSDIILELIAARSSERQGRAIDKDSSGSMEKKKQAGYF
jgi:sulfate adenylyltransferase subunit 2